MLCELIISRPLKLDMSTKTIETGSKAATAGVYHNLCYAKYKPALDRLIGLDTSR